MNWPGTVPAVPAMANTYIRGDDMRQRTCTVEDCARPHNARGMCTLHQRRLEAGKPVDAPINVRRSDCSVEGCTGRHVGRGYCSAHLRRVDAHGDPQAERPVQLRNVDPIERFWRFVVKASDEGCWTWLGSTLRGYGHFRLTGRQNVLAHRFAYEALVGPVPDGHQLDHLCHSRDAACPGGACPHRSCVNPAHLEPVSASVNALRRERGLVA